MHIISFCFHLLFLAFFFRLGTPWLMLMPLFGIFVQFLRQGGIHLPETDRQDYLRETLLKQGVVIAWILIMIGILGIFDLYHIPRYEIALDLLIVNIAGRFAGSRWNSKDAMRSFHIGLYVSLIMIFFMMPWYNYLTNFLLIGAFFGLMTACYSFMMFLIQPLDTKVSKHRGFLLFFYFLVSLLYSIFVYSYQDLYLMVVLAQVLLLVVYITIYFIQRYSYKIGWFHEHEEDAFLRVLSGKRLHEMKIVNEVDALLGLDDFLEQLPSSQKSMIGRMNIVLMMAQVIIFLWNIGGNIVWIRQMIFWFGIIVFFANYMLLRNIGFPHRFQRVVAFVMLNFGVYITLLNIFGNNIQQIVAFGMVWSLLSSVMMVSSEGIQRSLKLSRDDYITRATANIFASLCNLYFIIMLPFSPQLRFSIAFFYMGLQLFLILFGVKKVVKL